MSAYLPLVLIPIVLAAWGVFLLTLFDAFLEVLDNDAVRRVIKRVLLPGLLALPCGALVGFLRERFEWELLSAFPQALVGTPTLTWVCATLAAWAVIYQLFRWRRLRAPRLEPGSAQ